MATTNELIQKFFGMLGSWVQQNANKYQYVAIPPAQTDAQLPNDPLVPERDYFRLTLCEMFLSQSRAWFTGQYPAVHSSVFLKFADRERVGFSNVTRPPDQRLAEGVFLNYPLTDLLPYNGGVIEVELALIALKGNNSLALAIDVLQDFAGLVAAPLGQVLAVAEKVTSGIQRLVDTTNGEVHLGAHQSYNPEGANPLRPGYYAVIMSTDSQLGRRLFVKEDRLRVKDGGQVKNFVDCDYVLFKVESTSKRPDWRLSYINEPFKEAQKALILGETSKADVFRKNALLAAIQAPDLTAEDRWFVIERIKKELERVAALGSGAAGQESASLEAVMETAAPVAPRKGAPTVEAVFG
jgi:hypothetical protein